MRRLILCTLVTAQLTGCNALPTSGPHHYDIADGAAASLLSERNTVVFDYVLLDINGPFWTMSSILALGRSSGASVCGDCRHRSSGLASATTSR